MKSLLFLLLSSLSLGGIVLAGPPNPVRDAVYIGVIGASNPKDAGKISIKTTATGNYTAFGRQGSRQFTHKGKVRPDGTVDDNFSVKAFGGLISIPVHLVFAISPNGDKITGTVEANGGDAIPFELYEAARYTKANPAPQTGRFTVTLPSPGGDFPAGTGVAQCVVAFTGSVRVAGKLADGAALNCGGNLSPAGLFQLVNVLYQKKGSLGGTAQFSDTDKATGQLLWARPPEAVKGASIPGNYVGPITINLTRYFKPPAGFPAVVFNTNFHAAALSLSAGGLADVATVPFIYLNGANQFIVLIDNSKKLKLTLNRSTGLVSGSVDLEFNGSLQKRPLLMALDQINSTADGFFLGVDLSGVAHLEGSEEAP